MSDVKEEDDLKRKKALYESQTNGLTIKSITSDSFKALDSFGVSPAEAAL